MTNLSLHIRHDTPAIIGDDNLVRYKAQYHNLCSILLRHNNLQDRAHANGIRSRQAQRMAFHKCLVRRPILMSAAVAASSLRVVMPQQTVVSYVNLLHKKENKDTPLTSLCWRSSVTPSKALQPRAF